MDDKVRLFIWGDAVVQTGFSRVLHSIVDNFPKDFYDIHWLGVNYDGDPHPYPYKIYPASIQGDIYGFERMQDILSKVKPHLILTLNDPWITDKFLSVLLEIYEEGKIPPTFCYFPADATDHLPKWYKHFDYVNPVAYSKFGYDVAKAARPDLEFSIIPHGIDRKLFYPLPETKEELRRKFAPKSDDSYYKGFVVLNANRNQPRKRLDLTMKGFALFAKDKPENVKLHMHCGIRDSALNVEDFAFRLGITDRLVLSNRNTGAQQVPINELNIIYNTADVGINTSLGEGWGLCLDENTPIWTADGITRIKNVVVGDMVPTHTGNLRRVNKVYDNGTKNVVKVVLERYKTVVCTPEHMFLTKTGWKKAKELTNRDYVKMFSHEFLYDDLEIDVARFVDVVCDDDYVWQKFRRPDDFRRYKRFWNINGNLKTLAAYYLAYGYIDSGSAIFKINKEHKTKELIEYLRQQGIEYRIIYKQRNARTRNIYIVIDNKIISDLLYELFGETRSTLSISEAFNNVNLMPIIKKYIQLLGKQSDNKGFFYVKSPKLAYQFMEQLYGNKIPASIKLTLLGNSHEINVYTKYIAQVGIDEEFNDRLDRSHINDSGDLYTRVHHVEDAGKAHVYDLEVEEDHSYVANGFIVHNCSIEHAITGAPQILPAHSTCQELFEGIGFLIPVHTKFTQDRIMTDGGLVTPEDVAEQLEIAYRDKELRDKYSALAIEKFSQKLYDWKFISNVWHKLFLEALYGNNIPK